MASPIRSSKVVLVEERRDEAPETPVAPLRRYRLARLRFDGRMHDQSLRFEHLKRVYD